MTVANSAFERKIKLAKTILSCVDKYETRRYTELQTEVIRKNEWCTVGKFSRTFRWLVKANYIKRISRGVYEITEKGKAYLKVI